MDFFFQRRGPCLSGRGSHVLETAWPQELRERSKRSALNRVAKDEQVRWQQALARKGWAALNWPTEHGGAGLTPTQNYLLDMELARAGAPAMLPFGVTMVAPVIMKFGSEAQKQRFLPDILHSRVWWCQGYSEPGSGSDLASLATQAEDQGDHYSGEWGQDMDNARPACRLDLLSCAHFEGRPQTARHLFPAHRYEISRGDGQANHHPRPADEGCRKSILCIWKM